MRNPVNTILMADAYKYTHWLQLPKGTTKIVSYAESRGTKQIKISRTTFIGLQGFIKDYLVGDVIQEWMILRAKSLLGEVFGTHQYFNEAGFRKIITKHNGRLPIRIRAVREGKRVNLKNVLVTIESTDEELVWVVQWIETMLLRAIWYGKAVATISSTVRDIERKYAKICGCGLNPFFLNDFGARGVSSRESGQIGGTGHLVTYLGTDNMEAIEWAQDRYGTGATGYSVFATEHASTTIYQRPNEGYAYRTFLTTAPKDKIVSIVIDSYNTEHAVKVLLGTDLKSLILERTAPTVFRPDSGDPVEMSLKVVTWLWEIFGGTKNANGFKVLHPKVKVIYGDGINLQSMEEILQNLVNNGFSIENIIFGMGGKLLQGVDRDTFQDAIKACYAIVDGQAVEIYKDPITDSGKGSKRGLLKLIIVDGEYKTVKASDFPTYQDELEIVFENGYLIRDQTFQEIRDNAAQ